MPDNSNTFTDIHDGTKIKSPLKIILFQDEFLIDNPLGSSKRDLKMLGVYYTLGNLLPWNRSKEDSLQLVLLCKSKDLKYLAELGQQKVFEPLVKDLKILESRGITVGGHNVKGSLAYISGDNLGSHFLGGFVENFSRATYLCCYCDIKRDDFHNGKKFGESRTIDTFNTKKNKSY